MIVRVKLRELKTVYNNALKDDIKSFNFKGLKVFTAFCGYLLENLKIKGVKDEDYINLEQNKV